LRYNLKVFQYLLGHCRDLSRAEILSFDAKAISKENWMFSEKDLNIQNMGSIILKAVELTQEEFEETEFPKKIGLIVEKKDQTDILGWAKAKGAKKIRFTGGLHSFTYGHWKATKNWWVVKGGTILKIMDMFDQQSWGEYDMNLPHNDMRRGIINLKLARAMINIGGAKNVWDPFAGQGRFAIAGKDILNHILLSDIDPEVRPQAIANIESLSGKLHLPNVQEFLTYDVTKKLDDQEGIIIPKTVVTEGYLGRSISFVPDREHIDAEYTTQKRMWKYILKSFERMGVERAVFCLPWYPAKDIGPEFFEEVLFHSDYAIDHLNSRPILYSRKESFVGHAIFVINRKKDKRK
jgi:hypothetical protein